MFRPSAAAESRGPISFVFCSRQQIALVGYSRSRPRNMIVTLTGALVQNRSTWPFLDVVIVYPVLTQPCLAAGSVFDASGELALLSSRYFP